MGSAKKAVKSVVKAPFDLVKNVSKGNIKGIADSAARIASLGTLGVNKGSVLNVSPDIKGVDGKTSSEALRQEADDTARRRVALFSTQGDELGEEVFGVGKKKRGLLGN